MHKVLESIAAALMIIAGSTLILLVAVEKASAAGKVHARGRTILEERYLEFVLDNSGSDSSHKCRSDWSSCLKECKFRDPIIQNTCNIKCDRQYTRCEGVKKE